MPDGYVRLQHPDGRDHTFLLEADCGTEKQAAWEQKLTGYAAFFAELAAGRDPFWQTRPVPVIITIAPTGTRAGQLAHWTKAALDEGTFWFGTKHQIDDPPTFFAARLTVPTLPGGRTIAGALALGSALAAAPAPAFA